MITNFLKVYTPPLPKVRYGNNKDGGYIGVKTPTDILLSGGIGSDVSFELDFARVNDINAICVDSELANGNFTDMDDFINRNRFKNDTNISKLKFVDKLVGKDENDEFTNFHNYFEEFNDITLKLDIEGMEFEYINSLSDNQISKINQIFLEIHWLDKLDDFSFFEKLNQNHVLIHAHGNNCGFQTPEKDKFFSCNNILIPKVLEVTYLNKKIFSEFIPNKQPLPSALDFPNQPKLRDLDLNYPPFVYIENKK